MKINYEAKGNERKRLVQAISQITGTPAKYLGVPTCAYQVGSYTIDKNGVLSGPDNLDLEDALHTLHGFDGTERTYNEPDTYESGLGEMGAAPSLEELNHEAERFAEREMRRMELESQSVPDYSNRGAYGGDILAFEDVEMIEDEELVLGKKGREDVQGGSGMQPEDCSTPVEPDGLVIELPREAFSDVTLDNLKRLIESKAVLIQNALGVEGLPLEVTADRVSFPWFPFPVSPEEIKAYSAFIAALVKLAKGQKRVTAKPKEIANEKYAFRCFLLRLGFIGDEYKAERKILLSKLIGSSAFKSIDSKEVE